MEGCVDSNHMKHMVSKE